MSFLDKSKILELDSFLKSELKSVFDNHFSLISSSITDNNCLNLYYLYENDSDNVKILFNVTDDNKITKVQIYNPGNNKLLDNYVKFCSEFVDLHFLGYTDFQKMEAQIQMVTPLDVQNSIKVIGKTVIKSTYTGPNEDISAIIKILE